MAKGILGRKIGMTRIFDQQGFAVPVTVVDVSDNVVLQQKTIEKDGYQATQLGFGLCKAKKTIKPLLGLFSKAKSTPKYFIKEIVFTPNLQNELAHLEVGTVLQQELFKANEIIDVISISKGKGFSGSIKRHNQSRGPMTHGSRYHRRPGSMGPIKGNITGKKLPGQMGCTKVTLQNLKLEAVENDKKLFLIKGSIPGPNKSFVIIKSAVKKLVKEINNHA